MRHRYRRFLVVLALLVAGCAAEPADETGNASSDAAASDAADGTAADGASGDAGNADATADTKVPDTFGADAGTADASADTQVPDTSPDTQVPDTSPDTQVPDTSSPDATPTDTSPADPTQLPPTGAPLLPWLQASTYVGWTAEPAKHPSAGPHFGAVRTFFNDTLATSLKAGATNHPVGAAAVKELYASGSKVVGWAVMRKTSAGPGGSAWYWYEYYQGQKFADGQGTALCTGCHAPGKDYVLSKAP